jgi:hypothetical protein
MPKRLGEAMFVGALIALAGLLRDHTVLVAVLLACVVVGGIAIAWDEWGAKVAGYVSVPLVAVGFAIAWQAGVFQHSTGHAHPVAANKESFTTYNQSGGTDFNGGVHINGTPQPSVALGQIERDKKERGGYLTTANVLLKDSYAAENLVVAAFAPSIKLVNINRVGGGGLESFGCMIEGAPAAGAERPQSEHYRVFVFTAQPDPSMKFKPYLNVETESEKTGRVRCSP